MKSYKLFNSQSNIYHDLRHHLKVNNWLGDVIEFGDTVKYICDRNSFFEVDSMEHYELECLSENATRGYFTDPVWPLCVREDFKY